MNRRDFEKAIVALFVGIHVKPVAAESSHLVLTPAQIALAQADYDPTIHDKHLPENSQGYRLNRVSTARNILASFS
jgi:hypothetical protein